MINAPDQILLRGFFNDIDLNVHVYRSQFKEICEPLFKRAISLVRQALSAVKMQKNEIDEVLLVGGSTRIPRMQQTLKKFFNGLDLSRTVPPDHAVAYGAAVQAAALSGNKSFSEVSLSDVIPLSLGVEHHDGSMGVIVKRNSRIPASETSVCITVFDKQTTIQYNVYEGEHKLAEKNHFLGSFSLRGIAPAPKGKAKTDVAFTVDANGILSITAVERGTNNQGGMTLAFDKGRLSEVEIQRMIQEAEKLRADERAVIERNRASNKLEHYCTKVQRELKGKTVNKKLNSEEILVIRAKCVQIQAQLAKKRATKEEIEALDQELTDLCGSLSTALSESSSSDESESSSGDDESEAGLKRKAEHDSDRPAKDSNNTAVKIERANKRTKTDESNKNLSL